MPPGDDQDIYLVLADFGHLGRAWLETDEDQTDRETLLKHLLEGQYDKPIRVVSFNVAPPASHAASEMAATLPPDYERRVLLRRSHTRP